MKMENRSLYIMAHLKDSKYLDVLAMEDMVLVSISAL